ncbi:hypothetical protein [Aminobacter carboxidus]|uniref:hypothetical protein n=1 Tax=Aminobacter carboxidus TaxID=376165 RepID=UPI001FE30B7D|nr:hypothetical protein [Aminobacter carboxidus]
MARGEQRMVTIPTARDVAYSDPRSGRIANAGPTPMVGAALADAGQAVVQASYSLLELAEREKVDVANDRSNTVSTSLTRFLADEEQRFLQAREKSSESGIGFTRQFMEGHQQRANEFAKSNFEGLTKDAQTGYLNNILSRGNTLFEKADAFERDTKGAYYDRTTNTNLSTYRTQIQNNAAGFDVLKRQGLEAINSANMPEPWKAERRQQWEADAAESKWRWKYQQDPQTAIRDIKGIKVDTKGLSSAIQQTAQQLGVDPVDLATVMSYETGGTFDPWIKGPTTKWGTHRGLIQWGEPQAAKYGVTKDMPIEQQVAAAGQYLRDAGVKPGMGLIDIYSAINAGAPGRYDRSDHKAGGAPGTVADKVMYQMEGHKKKAADLLVGTYTPAPGDADLDVIPHERRDVLAAWGETQYQREQADQSVVAQSLIDEAATNAPVAIENTGSYSGAMPTEQQFTAAYGDKGPQKFETFQQVVEVSRTAYRMQTMPAAEVAALVKGATPVSTGADAAFEQKRYEAISMAADRTLKARDADPAAYVRQAFPRVDAAWKAAKDPASYQAAVAASIAAQQQLGVDVVRPLPKAIAADAVDVFNDLDRPGADRIAALSHVLMTTKDRDQRSVLFEQLVEAGLPDITEGAVEAMSRGDEGAARRLFMAAMVDPAKLPGLPPANPDAVAVKIQDLLMAQGEVGDVYYGIRHGSAQNFIRAQRDAALISNAVDVRMRNGQSLDQAIAGVSDDLFGKVRVVSGDDRVNAEILVREDQDPEAVINDLAWAKDDVEAALQAALKRPSAVPEGPVTGLVAKGNIDLENRPMARNADGSITTGRALSLDEDGRQVLVPTVSPDGRLLSDDEAIELYRRTGEFLGKFDSPANAAAYGQALHATLENFYAERASGMWGARDIIGLNYIDNVLAEGFFRNSEDGFVFINPYLGAPVTDRSGRPIVFTLPKHDPSKPRPRYPSVPMRSLGEPQQKAFP